MGKIIATFITSLIAWPVLAWDFMLAVGVAHLHWWPQVPVIGFTTSLVITFLMFTMMTGGAFLSDANSRR